LNHHRIEATVGAAERRRGAGMECPTRRDRERAYQARLSEYTEARSSVCYQVSKKFAAFKNVEMERAKSDLEEHHLVCVRVVRVIALLPEQNGFTGLRQLAAQVRVGPPLSSAMLAAGSFPG
jgi:hypothetical protein